MHLRLQTDYALRLLMHLAVANEPLTTIAASAKRYGISKNHLMKVAHNLVQLGYVVSVRGRTGGLKLAKDAGAINVGAVIRALEADAALVVCFPNGAGGCCITPSCRLKGLLVDAEEAFYKTLDKATLNDLVVGNDDLSAILAPA
ncbi:MAG: Rrf2 family transcriptional regulator [Alphaproteobacteria bacterium]|nr:Rrf2 family transcriptional regulator [Alphaproteobacteria bacterium]